MKQEDLRIIKSRKKLHQALIDLVAEKDYEAITVRELAEKAGVGYKTFYRHYDDKDALLYAIVNELFEELMSLRQLPTSLANVEKNAEIMLKFAKENQGAVYILFNSPAFQHLLNAMVTTGLAEGIMVYEASRENFSDNANLLIPDVVAYHFITSIMNLVRWWVENDMQQSIEEMAEHINALIVRPIWNLSQK